MAITMTSACFCVSHGANWQRLQIIKSFGYHCCATPKHFLFARTVFSHPVENRTLNKCFRFLHFQMDAIVGANGANAKHLFRHSHRGINDSVNVFVRINFNCFDMPAKCARSRQHVCIVRERLLSFIISRVVNAMCVSRILAMLWFFCIAYKCAGERHTFHYYYYYFHLLAW